LIVREMLAQPAQSLEECIILDRRKRPKSAAASLRGLGNEPRHGKSECTVLFERTQPFLGYEQGSMFGGLFDATGSQELRE
jgi:hypothetical protein